MRCIKFISKRSFILHYGKSEMRKLPVCEICGLEAAEVVECSQCGAKFCEECGDVKKKLCYDCLGWDEEEEDEEFEELEEDEEEEEEEDWEEWFSSGSFSLRFNR